MHSMHVLAERGKNLLLVMKEGIIHQRRGI